MSAKLPVSSRFPASVVKTASAASTSGEICYSTYNSMTTADTLTIVLLTTSEKSVSKAKQYSIARQL